MRRLDDPRKPSVKVSATFITIEVLRWAHLTTILCLLPLSLAEDDGDDAGGGQSDSDDNKKESGSTSPIASACLLVFYVLLSLFSLGVGVCLVVEGIIHHKDTLA